MVNPKILFIVLTAALVSFPALPQSSSQIHLSNGLNSIDLNSDGLPDAVFSATYDNNTSHPGDTLSIFIRHDKNWFIVPVPDDDGFTWTDLKLSGSALKISGIELHHYNGRVYFVRAVKYAGNDGGEDMTDKLRVKFSRFQLEENRSDPGTSLFFWDLAGSYITEQRFDDVDEAFQTLDMGKFH